MFPIVSFQEENIFCPPKSSNLLSQLVESESVNCILYSNHLELMNKTDNNTMRPKLNISSHIQI